MPRRGSSLPPIPAGLKEWPETREEESPREETTESDSGEEE